MHFDSEFRLCPPISFHYSPCHSTFLCPTHSYVLSYSLIVPISFSLFPLHHSFIPSIHLPPQPNFLSLLDSSSSDFPHFYSTFFTSQSLTPLPPLTLSPKTSPILPEDPPTWSSPDQQRVAMMPGSKCPGYHRTTQPTSLLCNIAFTTSPIVV